jgi:hypothetical protein
MGSGSRSQPWGVSILVSGRLFPAVGLAKGLWGCSQMNKSLGHEIRVRRHGPS